MQISQEASKIGLRAGYWPQRINWDGKSWEKLRPKYDREGELLYVEYSYGQDLMIVFND
jgi:hypothetical protein